MIRDIELVLPPGSQFREQLKPPHVSIIQERKEILTKNLRQDEFNCYLCEAADGRLYFVPGRQEFRNELFELRRRFQEYKKIYKLSYEHYKRLLNEYECEVRPVIVMTDHEDRTNITNGLIWQTTGAFTAAQSAENVSWNIGTQTGFPFGMGLLGGVIRGYLYCREYEKRHGEPPPPEIKRAIIKDSAAFGTKLTIAMGAGELGLFVGKCIITACSTTPFTLWIPVMLALCAGMFQGITSVMTQMADEKRKYGEVRSSRFELAKTFITSFVGAVVGQICSYIPFASLLAKAILKPVAEIMAKFISVIAMTIVSYCLGKAVPKFVDSASYILSSIKGKNASKESKKEDRKTNKEEKREVIKKIVEDKAAPEVERESDFMLKKRK